MRTLLFGFICAAGVALAMTALTRAPSAAAGPGKNLQVYPKDTDLKVIKKDMKVVTKALGVQCDFCHDLDGFDKDDIKYKGVARDMMRMVASINKQLKSDGLKSTVSCKTCHQGNKEPKN